MCEEIEKEETHFEIWIREEKGELRKREDIPEEELLLYLDEYFDGAGFDYEYGDEVGTWGVL